MGVTVNLPYSGRIKYAIIKKMVDCKKEMSTYDKIQGIIAAKFEFLVHF
jgi:hypothetical protein